MTRRCRVLLIAEAANPEWVSVPLQAWFIIDALRREVDAHIVTQVRNREAFLRAGLVEGQDFTAIDNEHVARPLFLLGRALGAAGGKGYTIGTAMSALAYPSFERMVWDRFGEALRAGAYDVVHRVTPRTPTANGMLAQRCQEIGLPFLVGPLNGGLPWPRGYERVRWQERDVLSYFRGSYKLLPGRWGTLSAASVIMCGSRATMAEIPPRFADKTVYVEPNGIDPGRFDRRAVQRGAADPGPLRACFVGRLVPYKCPDLLLEACEPFLKARRMHLTIVGDGPFRGALEALVARLGIGDQVRFTGNLPHTDVQNVLAECEILTFPSIREFGGAVLLEAMAVGVVPVVVDYGGPGEFVSEDTGFKIPVAPPAQLRAALRDCVGHILENRDLLPVYSQRALASIDERFLWSCIARKIKRHYEAALADRTATGPGSRQDGPHAGKAAGAPAEGP
ncbi:MAG: glycosyltransferase [Alkalilacustris sp.]